MSASNKTSASDVISDEMNAEFNMASLPIQTKGMKHTKSAFLYGEGNKKITNSIAKAPVSRSITPPTSKKTTKANGEP